MGSSRMVIDQQNKFWEELAPIGEKVCVCAFCLFPFGQKLVLAIIKFMYFFYW